MEPYLDPTRHPSGETLEFYSLGRLEEAEAEQVDEHLFGCAVCQDSVSESDAYHSALRSVLRETATVAAPKPWTCWWKQWIPHMPSLAGVVAAAVLGVVLMRPSTDLQPTGITLRAERAGTPDSASHAPAGVPLDLNIQSSYVSPGLNYRLLIVDSAGRRAWSGGFDTSVAHVREGLASGQYWVRLYDTQDHLLQEYGLQLD